MDFIVTKFIWDLIGLILFLVQQLLLIIIINILCYLSIWKNGNSINLCIKGKI